MHAQHPLPIKHNINSVIITPQLIIHHLVSITDQDHDYHLLFFTYPSIYNAHYSQHAHYTNILLTGGISLKSLLTSQTLDHTQSVQRPKGLSVYYKHYILGPFCFSIHSVHPLQCSHEKFRAESATIKQIEVKEFIHVEIEFRECKTKLIIRN